MRSILGIAVVKVDLDQVLCRDGAMGSEKAGATIAFAASQVVEKQGDEAKAG